MITENISTGQKIKNMSKNNKNLRIIKQGNDGLIVSNGNEQMIFKRYNINDKNMTNKLLERYHLKHESLIRIHNIEYQNISKILDEKQQIKCGILLEKYIKTMQQSIKQMIKFTHQEVIQSFIPIKQVIDYMVYHNYDPGQLTYSSIVCNQQYQIKFLESFLQDSTLNFKSSVGQIYQQLAQLIYSLLFPDKKQSKSWKYKYQIAQKQLSNYQFHFFKEIYKKFNNQSTKSVKSKKIKKKDQKITKNNNQFISKYDSSSPQKKSHHQNIISCQVGKQNLIIQ